MHEGEPVIGDTISDLRGDAIIVVMSAKRDEK